MGKTPASDPVEGKFDKGDRHKARIPLKSDDGWVVAQVAEALDVALSTVYRIKQHFVEEGLEGVCRTNARPTVPGSWTTGAKPT